MDIEKKATVVNLTPNARPPQIQRMAGGESDERSHFEWSNASEMRGDLGNNGIQLPSFKP